MKVVKRMITKRLNKDIPNGKNKGCECGSCGIKLEHNNREYQMFGNMCERCDSILGALSRVHINIQRATNDDQVAMLARNRRKLIKSLRQYTNFNVEKLLYDIGRFTKAQSDQRLRREDGVA